MGKGRLGPIVGFCMLLAVAVLGAISSPPTTGPDSDRPVNHGQAPADAAREGATFSIAVSTWAKDNKETIEPIAAVVGLFVAASVAFVTYLLYRATAKLAVSTDELAKAAREQVAETQLARAVAERE